MRVADNVELSLLHESKDVVEFDGNGATRREHGLEPGHHIAEIVGVGQRMVDEHQIGTKATTDEVGCCRRTEGCTPGRRSTGRGGWRVWLKTEDAHATLRKKLEQKTVTADNIQNSSRRSQTQTADQFVRPRSGMGKRRRRKSRSVAVHRGRKLRAG